MTPRPRAGFTAEELMVVLGMILLMAAGFMLATSHVRESARRTTCASNQRQLALAARMYMADNTGHMPPPAQMHDALDVYVKNEWVFVCPTAEAGRHRRDEGESWDPQDDEGSKRSDYLFDAAVHADDPAARLLLADDAPRHLRHTWLGARLDGGIRRYPARQWSEFWDEVTVDEPAR